MKHTTRIGSLILSLSFAGAVLAQAQEAPAPGQAAGAGASVAFDTVDQNSDGRISQAEAQSNQALRTQFQTLDANGDGYLSQDEFARWNNAAQSGGGMTAPGGAAPGAAGEPAQRPQSMTEQESESASHEGTPAE